MRESLTIFAVALILVLSALLVGPYLINWNSQRDWLAARLSEAAGAKVRISGPIDVKLLPRPIFRASAVAMEGATPQDPRLTAERLDAELSINGLLQGAVQFVDARITAPRLDVTVRRDGSVVAPTWDVQNPQKIQFSHVIISNGTLAIKDEQGADRLLLHGIDAQGEADTLFGPAKLSGAFEGASGRLTFRLNTSAYASRQVRTRLVVDGGRSITHADTEGVVTIAAGMPAAPGHAAIAYEGGLNLAGSLRVADGAAPVPWRLAASSIKADAAGITAPTVELRAGVDARAFVANGSALVTLGATPAATVQLRSRQLDLDRIAVAPDVAPDTPRPSAAQWTTALQDLASRTKGLPVALSLDAGVDAVTTNDRTFTDAALTLVVAPGIAPRTGFRLSGPNGSHVSLDGVVEPGPVPAFKGRAMVETRDLGTASRWIEPFWPGTADWVSAHAPIGSLAFDAQVETSRVGLSARAMNLTLDGSSFKGTLSLTEAVGNERARLFADLSADALDLDRLPELSDLAMAASPLDVSLGIAADAVKVSRLGSREIDAGRLDVHLTKDATGTTLDHFAVADFEGATVTATGRLGADRRLSTEGHVEAKRLEPLAAVLQQAAPNAVTGLLASRSAVLSPLGLDFKLDGTLDRNGTVTPTRASGGGTLGATRFSVSVTPQPGRDTADARLVLDAPEAAGLMRQLGLSVGPVPLGAAHAEVLASGTPDTGYQAKATATLPGATLSFTGHARSDAGGGHLTASGADAVPLLKAFGSPGPAMAARWPWAVDADLGWGLGKVGLTKLTGRLAGTALSGTLAYDGTPPPPDSGATPVLTGDLSLDTLQLSDLTGLLLSRPTPSDVAPAAGWSGAKFAAVPAWPRSAVALHVGSLGLWPGVVARDAAMLLALGPVSLTFGDMVGHVANGTVGGTVTLRRDGPSASLSGQVHLNDLAVALPSLAGRLSATLNLAGTGTSPDALVGSLAGDGAVTIADATIPRLDPGALLRVAASYDRDGTTIDDAAVKDALGTALDKAPLALGTVTAPATLAAGSLRLVGLQPPRADATVTAEGTYNLRAQTLALKATLASTSLPKDWKGDPPQVTVTWSGPLLSPVRDVDGAAFSNGIAARAIARDQERIELMQDDLRERAFFARRLRAIEAEQQAARAAAQAQKIIPLPPRAGEIRLPKVPLAPTATAPKPFAPPAAASGDGLTSFIDKLNEGPKSPNEPEPAPFNIAPVPKVAPPNFAPPLTGSSPGQEGLY